jgi:hypothetical protein
MNGGCHDDEVDLVCQESIEVRACNEMDFWSVLGCVVVEVEWQVKKMLF